MLGDKEYTPTQLQTQTLLAYLQDDQSRSPAIILDKTGHSRDNWWKWLVRYPNFLAWWNRTIERVFTDQRLNDLYQALYRRGMQQDTAAVKLLMQRFDPKYTERSTQDHRVGFAGYEPAAADDSRERQRKALAKQVQALPDRTHANACDHKGHAGLITGGVEVSPGSTAPIHAQSQSAEHAQDIDNILDIEPESKVDPPGGPFQE